MCKKINTNFLVLIAALLFVSLSFNGIAYAQSDDTDADVEDVEVSEDKKLSVKLIVGDSTVIKTDEVIERLGVGSASVAGASRISDQEILLNATGVGETNLIVWFDEDKRVEYKVEVFDRSFAQRIKQDLELLLAGIDGITIKTAGVSVLLEGEVFSDEEINKVNAVVENFDNVINLVTEGEVYKKLLAKEIESTIAIEGVNVRYTKRGYIVEGVVVSDFEVQYAIGIAKSFSENVIDALYIDPNHLKNTPTADVVQLDLKIIEVTRDAISDFSSDFTAAATSDFSISNQSPTSGTATLNLSDNNLRSLKENGKGRILVEQSVIVESTKPADIFVGDEVPIPVSQSGGDNFTIEFKEVGVKMRITPFSFANSTVNLNVNAESTAITGEGLGGAPQISKVQVNTSAKVKSNENLVFAGLIQHRETNSFFGGGFKLDKTNKPNRILNDRREIVIMIKPILLKSTNDSLKGIKKSVERAYKNYEIDRIQRLKK